jgi:L-alanine-DL-glutamate epimerase-like enolase superfamily enzyme
VVTGRDSFDVTGASEAIHRSARNVGSRGLVMQAQSAVDIALWATRTARGWCHGVVTSIWAVR